MAIIPLLANPNPITMTLMGLILSSGMAILPFLIRDYAIVDEVADRINTVRSDETHDFIVVGSGSAGSVVANRLSEKFRVLLLEAGGEPFPLQNVPLVAPVMLSQPSLDWNFYTVPQKYSCYALYNQSSYWPRGKSLGGTSQLNFMVWLRGHPFDYDTWSQITGDERWSYDEVLPYFKKSETFTGEGDSNFHGYDGEVTLSPASYSPIAKYFLRAAEELGYPIVDQNAPYQEGFNEHVYNQKRGQRWSAYNAFIQPIRNTRRDRLTIRKYSLVTKVLFKGSNNLAYGVEYERGGVRYVAKVNKEVILSAGTIGSPKILMLSGIGPQQHLESVGIKTRRNLPGVGQNLQDHVIGLVGPIHINKAEGNHLTFLPSRDNSNIFQYLASGTGPLSQAGVMASGFVASNRSKLLGAVNGIIWPDIQLILLGIPKDKDAIDTISKVYNLKKEIAEEFYAPVFGQDSFNIMSIASRPKSRGQIQLANNDPKTPPLIDPNYYQDPEDVAVTIEGIRKIQDLIRNSKTFQDIGAKLSEVPFPSCKEQIFDSDDYWNCYLRHYTLSVYHHSSTCSMGKIDDLNAVVDSTLKVIGTDRLRVVDASVMPQLVSSNPQAAITLIGEVGSRFIKEYWGIAP